MHGGDDIAVGEEVKIRFRTLISEEGKSIFIKLKNLDDSVGKARDLFARQFNVSKEYLLFIFKGRIITDDRTFKSYGIRVVDTVDVIKSREASYVNFHSKEERAEDLVVDLETLDISGLANLVNDPKTIRILNANNYRMLAICESNISVLSLLDNRIKSSENMNPSAVADASSHENTQTFSNQAELQSMLFSNGRVKEILENQLSPGIENSAGADGSSSRFQPYQIGSGPRMRASSPQTLDLLKNFPDIGQTASQQIVSLSPTLGTSRNDGAGTSHTSNVGQSDLYNLVKETYADQLSNLLQMGFNDTNENTIALFATAGDLDAAVLRIRTGIPSVNPSET